MELQTISRELLQVKRPERKFKSNIDLRNHLVAKSVMGADGKPQTVHEFIGTDNFAAAFYERQRYELDSGRLDEPLLYPAFYNIITDPTLPRNVPVQRLGPSGVVFEKIEEGGEVKWATVGQSNFSVPIYQYGFGIQYTKSLVMFNELWSLGEVERDSGTALNALLNHIHINPILQYSFGANNLTNGTALTYDATATLPEKYLRTFEEAITHGVNDTTNPRRGPFALLCSTSNLFTAERAITVVPQQGITRQSSAVSQIQSIIAYNGWTGERGGLVTTYPGVTAGTAYLIDLGRRNRHFRSYVKQDLQRENGNADVSRFILEATVWDIWFGSYTDAAGAIEKITLPTAS